MQELHYRRCVADPQVFIQGNMDDPTSLVVLLAFVDDLFLVTSEAQLEAAKEKIGQHVEMKWLFTLDALEWRRFLGREINLVDGGYMLRMAPTYYDTIIQRCGFVQVRAVTTPFGASGGYSGQEHEYLTEELTASYRAAVGKLLWAVPVRPDLQFITKELARCMQFPTYSQWAALKRVCRYLAATTEAVLVC